MQRISGVSFDLFLFVLVINAFFYWSGQCVLVSYDFSSHKNDILGDKFTKKAKNCQFCLAEKISFHTLSINVEPV